MLIIYIYELAYRLKYRIESKRFLPIFFSNAVLGLDSEGLQTFGDIGALQTPLLVCLLVAWVVTGACLFRGIRSSGKVVYFTATFPFIIMLVLTIAGLQLPGAYKVFFLFNTKTRNNTPY